MTLKIKIREMAIARGILTAYQLQKRANLVPSSAARLYRNQVSQITMETLEKLLEALDCDAGDLFVRQKSLKQHSLKKAKVKGTKLKS